MQIVILGMHRSGTSAVTRLVNMMGAYAGSGNDLIGANDENPKGFWERQDVIDINDALLRYHQCEWYDVSRWPLSGAEDVAAAPAELDARIQSLTHDLVAHGHYVIKDPRLCHTLGYWKPYLPQPFVIIVHRDPMEIALSLQKRNGFSIAAGLALWEAAAMGIVNAQAHYPHLVIDYRDVIEQPVGTCQRIATALQDAGASGLHCPSDEEISRFIEPSLYRNRAGDASAYTSAQRRLLEATQQNNSGAVYPLTECAKLVMQANAPVMAMGEAAQEASEALSRAMATISAHEMRLDEVMIECNTAQQRADFLEAGYSQLEADLRTTQAERARLVAALGAAEAELHAIKSTRWWKLRNKLVG